MRHYARVEQRAVTTDLVLVLELAEYRCIKMEKVTTKTNSGHAAAQQGQAIMPMRLVATMDIDNTGPSCVPRLCTFQVTRVTFPNKRAPDVSGDNSTFVLAVKMQGIRRVLRSNEIPLDTPVDVTFEFSYPHYLKPSGNKLEIMLQKRKRTKNRPVMGFKTVLGFKTAAAGFVDMAQILQRPTEYGQKLHLLAEGKDGTEAELVVGNLTSQPLEEDLDGDAFDAASTHLHGEGRRSRSRRRRKSSSSKPFPVTDRSPDIDNNSDDEDEFLDDDYLDDADPDAASDSDGAGGTGTGPDPGSRRSVKLRSSSNLKQRFAALLRKFKVNEDEGLDGVVQVDPDTMKKKEIEDIFNELEDCYRTDSEPEEDEVSIMSVLSTPRPALRPFFSEGSGSGSLRSQDILPVTKQSKKLLSNHGDASNCGSSSHVD